MRWISVAAILVFGGCQTVPEPASKPSASSTTVPLTLKPGVWRGVLKSPGGELPFGLNVPAGESGPEVINGVERVAFDRLRQKGDRILFEIDVYDAVLDAKLVGDRMVGEWRKRDVGRTTRLPFEASFGYPHRFTPSSSKAAASESLLTVEGVWTMAFTDEDGVFPGQAELQQRGEMVTGTILTATGDYRYLDGDYVNGRLRLSTFDGAHAFLFVADVDDDGKLNGAFWSRDTYKATFVARPKTDADALPDPYREVSLTSKDGRLKFAFPDTKGRMLSSEDPRFTGKVVVVEVFGTWCPNCNDLAPLLVDWHRRYRDQGLEVVGLAYEYTEDVNEANERLKAYAARHGVEFPLLRAGISDKDAASATLPSIDRIKSYPTTIFIGRDGKVSKIHSGFAGPATGEHHRQLVAELEAEVSRLLRSPMATRTP